MCLKFFFQLRILNLLVKMVLTVALSPKLDIKQQMVVMMCHSEALYKAPPPSILDGA